MGVKACIGEEMTFRDFKLLTKGRHEKSINHQSGMPRHGELKIGSRKGAVPATWFPSKEKGGEYARKQGRLRDVLRGQRLEGGQAPAPIC